MTICSQSKHSSICSTLLTSIESLCNNIYIVINCTCQQEFKSQQLHQKIQAQQRATLTFLHRYSTIKNIIFFGEGVAMCEGVAMKL